MDDIKNVLENIQCLHKQLSNKRIYVQTFGNFEVFIDGKPICFARSKTKELFAYLISRQGALCSNNEIIAVIWEEQLDSPALKSHFRHLVSDLTNTLKSVDASDIIFRKRGYIAIVPDKITCDLYDFLNGDFNAIRKYMGEFMAQYSWADIINAYLIRNLDENYLISNNKISIQ